MELLMRFAPVLCLLLSACSNAGVWPDTSSTMPTAPPAAAGPPNPDAVQKGVAKIVTDAKLTKPVEISPLRKAEHGPGDYFVCLREVNPPPDQPRRTYSVFFNAVYTDARLSVILEECEQQRYTLMN